jgi:hypothetical protein
MQRENCRKRRTWLEQRYAVVSVWQVHRAIVGGRRGTIAAVALETFVAVHREQLRVAVVCITRHAVRSRALRVPAGIGRVGSCKSNESQPGAFSGGSAHLNKFG